MLSKCTIGIADSQGNLRDVDEILSELRKALDAFSTHSMNETALYLQGKRDGLKDAIEYLERVA